MIKKLIFMLQILNSLMPQNIFQMVYEILLTYIDSLLNSNQIQIFPDRLHIVWKMIIKKSGKVSWKEMSICFTLWKCPTIITEKVKNGNRINIDIQLL